MHYRAYRFPCDHPVTVTLDSGSAEARLINVSPEGARLTGLGALRPGSTLQVEIGASCEAHQAEVRWSRAGSVGLRFAKPLGTRDMAVIRKTGGHAWMPGPAAPLRHLHGMPRKGVVM